MTLAVSCRARALNPRHFFAVVWVWVSVLVVLRPPCVCYYFSCFCLCDGVSSFTAPPIEKRRKREGKRIIRVAAHSIETSFLVLNRKEIWKKKRKTRRGHWQLPINFYVWREAIQARNSLNWKQFLCLVWFFFTLITPICVLCALKSKWCCKWFVCFPWQNRNFGESLFGCRLEVYGWPISNEWHCWQVDKNRPPWDQTLFFFWNYYLFQFWLSFWLDRNITMPTLLNQHQPADRSNSWPDLYSIHRWSLKKKKHNSPKTTHYNFFSFEWTNILWIKRKPKKKRTKCWDRAKCFVSTVSCQWCVCMC